MFDTLGKFDIDSESVSIKCRGQHFCNDLLSGIVIHLYRITGGKSGTRFCREFRESCGQFIRDLEFIIKEPCIDTETREAEIGVANEGQHTVEDAGSHSPAHGDESSVLSNQRCCVKNEMLGVESEIFIRSIKFRDLTGYINRLVMQHQRHNTISGGIFQISEIPRFVDKYADDFVLHIF